MHEFESFLLRILLQLIVIIAAARCGAWMFGKFGQPQVVGEIAAGLLLGPSVLGRLAPGFVSYVFPNDTAIVFRSLSELGLMLLMFLIGTEFDFSHLRKVGRISVSVAAVGIALPFALGIAVALSITAIPILGRIMIELDIHRSRLGTLTITAAAIDDALGWILLAAVSTLIHGDFELAAIMQMLLLTFLFVAGCWLVARFGFRKSHGYLLDANSGELGVRGLSLVLIAIFLAAAATNAIGIFSIFGPFILGAMLSDQLRLCEAVKQRLQVIVYTLFLPIFFTFTGLRTNIGLLDSWAQWLMCGALVLAAVIGKMSGCGLMAKLGGLSWRASGCVALMMNTRALMGLIAINVGRDIGVIPDSVFCMLVIMALVTTFMTTPLLRRLLGTGATRQRILAG
ncbi:MAG: cation:proton antiporter [Aureliella sp.]